MTTDGQQFRHRFKKLSDTYCVLTSYRFLDKIFYPKNAISFFQIQFELLEMNQNYATGTKNNDNGQDLINQFEYIFRFYEVSTYKKLRKMNRKYV